MNSIATFRHRLLQINAEALASPIPDLSAEMARTTQRLKTEYGDISRGSGDQQGIATAVIGYLKNHHLLTYRDIKLVCFGVSSPYGTPLTQVIEHETLFPKLLKEVEILQPEPRKFRRCYQGLLKGYLRYPGLQTDNIYGRKNWFALREFLAQNCKALNKQKPVTEWSQALYEHRNLLADNPCKPYGKAMLGGDMSVIEELRNRLGVDDDTWVMNELILAQVQAATALKDPEFVLQVLPLVKLLERHSLLITKGLSLLLRRYVVCKVHTEHHTLREAALREWKSPWLEANKPMWYGQIGEAATNMVSLWLKRRTIQDFFELLQADGQADRKRMEFWLKYAEAIDDIWLALGQHSLYNNKPDYKRIRQNMAGRYMALEGGSYNQDNAFLMRIGGYVFIEFGKQNNACHVFLADNLPFKFGQKSVLGTQDGLKNKEHPGHRRTLSHREGWQGEFTDFLRYHANATPGENKPKPVSSIVASHISSSTVPSVKPRVHSIPIQNEQAKPLDIKQLQEFCISHNLHFDDHRDKGGAFWVRASETHEPASTMLKSVGFRYKEGRGWWLE
ncbi:EH signature domain-containing protein [Methylicorpusculum oleiharenae]|uniref:EH signature domain-containing protein n=1 Tax=Methylicorpusculum oleiharenae TaxID=1338687 RepID=UPI00135CF49E|nr:EH signature domain-containing protein [Methylicorpusculum oleiharenae]MCD2451120.1 EH signature domain-containing protein [Methylicorpusculum oleiharenae]